MSDQNDFPELEAIMKKAIKEKQPFERLTVTKENLLKLFAYNPFKVTILSFMREAFEVIHLNSYWKSYSVMILQIK